MNEFHLNSTSLFRPLEERFIYIYRSKLFENSWKNFNNFIYLFLAVLGLHCRMGFSIVLGGGVYSLVVVLGLLTVVASLVAEHRLMGNGITNLDGTLKSGDITLPTKVHLLKPMVFPVVTYGCENWTIWKAECQRILVFKLCCWRRPLRVPWTSKRSNQSILKEIFIGRTDGEVETPILWPPDAKSQLTGKDPDEKKDWRQEETGVTEDEMVGWHHWLNGHEFEQILGDSEGQGSLACCHSWGHK